MTKPQRETTKTPAEKTSTTPPGGGPWMSRRTGMILMTLVSLAVVVLVWFSAPENASWGEILRLSFFIIASVWLVFAFTFTLSRWLRR